MNLSEKNCSSSIFELIKSIAIYLPLLCSALFTIPGYGQLTLEGKITDAATGEGLPNANIVLKGTYTGSVSNADGRYSLTVYRSAPFTIIFSYVGYRNQEIEVTGSNSQTEINVALETQAIGTNEVVITAQLREQELQKVPLSVSVVDQEFIAKTRIQERPGDIAFYTPGLSGNDPEVGSSYYVIRGIGSNAFGVGLESSVGVFVDDIYAGRVTTMAALFDLERIETIKGPQNTLFGRNASAGVISIISNKPQNRRDLELLLNMGNEGQKEANYIANYPFAPNLFVRLAGRLSSRDGIRRVTNFANQEIGKFDLIANRLSFLYRPGNDWAFQLNLEYQKNDGGGFALYSINTDLGVTGSPFERDVELSTKGHEDTDVFVGRLQIDKLLTGNIYLKAITGLRSPSQDLLVDADGSPTPIMDWIYLENSTCLSQDIRLMGLTEKVNWLIATSFYSEAIENTQGPVFNDDAFVGGIPIGENELGFSHPAFTVGDSTSDQLLGPLNPAAREENVNKGDYLSFALYGDVTYALSRKLNVSAGVRYSLDQKKFTTALPPGDGVTEILFGDNLLGPNTGDGKINNNDTWSGIQPRLAFDYSPQKDMMLYASYARGYKAGGYNFVTAIPFDEEKANAYEVGIKSAFGNRAYKLNISGYYIDYTDLQVQSIVNAIIAVDNAADVESKGVEIEAAANLPGGVSILANASIGEARYKNYQVGEEDFSGNTPDRSPDNSYTLIAQYTKPIRSLGNFVARADYGYQSKVYYGRQNRDDLSQEGYGLFNVHLALEKLLRGRLDVIFYGTNLTDQKYLVHAEDAIGFGVTTVRNIPRLLGIKINLNLAQ